MTDTLTFLKDVLYRLEEIKDVNLRELRSDLVSIDTDTVIVHSTAECEKCDSLVDVEIQDVDTSDIEDGIKDALCGAEMTEKELGDVISMLKERILYMETPRQKETLFPTTTIEGTGGDMDLGLIPPELLMEPV